ncbi:hypothetical protein QZH41_017093, partial [Actinostola sp. cb2023]
MGDDLVDSSSSFRLPSSYCSHQQQAYRRDGCWAWLVCSCAVLCNIVIFGSTKTFGVIYPLLLDEFHQGKAKTALVGSLLIALSFSFTVVATKLINRFGTRVVGVSGGVIASLGYLATSFDSSIEQMCFTFSIVVGL